MAGPNRDVDAIIDATADERRVILARLREIIHAGDHEIVEAVKWRKPSNPLGAAVFEHDWHRLHPHPPEGARPNQLRRWLEPSRPQEALQCPTQRQVEGHRLPGGVEIDAAGLKALVRAGVERRRQGEPQATRAPKPSAKNKAPR